MINYKSTMDFRVVTCLCLVLFLGVSAKKSRIYGGTLAEIIEFPHLVSIRTYHTNELLCGGSIISKWNILTAAHCLTASAHNLKNIRVYTGSSSSIDNVGQCIKITKVNFHPDCNVMDPAGLYLHDIAVVKLKTAIEFSYFQNKIPLPSRPPTSNDVALIAGWGKTENNQGLSSTTFLKKLLALVLNATDCAQRAPLPIASTQFCTYNSVGNGVCAGDDGGAVVSNGELYGVVSFSYGCAQGVPDVHTAVYYYLDFIRTHLRE